MMVVPHEGISALIRRGMSMLPLSLPCEDTARRWLFAKQEAALTKTKLAGTLILDFAASRLCEPVVEPLVFGVLLHSPS